MTPDRAAARPRCVAPAAGRGAPLAAGARSQRAAARQRRLHPARALVRAARRQVGWGPICPARSAIEPLQPGGRLRAGRAGATHGRAGRVGRRVRLPQGAAALRPQYTCSLRRRGWPVDGCSQQTDAEGLGAGPGRARVRTAREARLAELDAACQARQGSTRFGQLLLLLVPLQAMSRKFVEDLQLATLFGQATFDRLLDELLLFAPPHVS